MQLIIPDKFEEVKESLPPFVIPDFVKLMPEFIKRGQKLKESILNSLGSFQHLGIVGIGGSQVQPYIFRPLANVNVTHLEVPDPYVLKELLQSDPDQLRIIYISRSGTTREVLSFIPYLYNYSSLVVTNGGPLLKIAKQLGWHFVSVGHDISGRFAIQNELGIVPMVSMGIDPTSFLTSLKKSYEKYFKVGSAAEKLAVSFYNLEKLKFSKMRILPSGTFTHGLGFLFTQLINESVPKKETDEIDAFLHIMPRSAHSDLQRWYGGKKDSYIVSMICKDYEEEFSFSYNLPKNIRQLLPEAKAKIADHLNITSKAVEDTFPGPVFKIVLEKNSIEELSQCVGFLHAVAYRLCQIKGSNPFDQPAVQEYKDKATQIYKNI